MRFKEGYVYHIKDSYFSKVNDDKLMKNKENGNFRPTFYCLKDYKTSLLWVVPLSSRVDKYKAIYDKQLERYGESLGIYIGSFDGNPSAFLIQNMFPITEDYLDHIHTRNGNPVPVKNNISYEVKSRIQKARQLTAKGKKVVFPDIIRLENLMLDEIKQKKIIDKSPKPFQISRSQMKQNADKLKSNEKPQSHKSKQHSHNNSIE